MTETTTEFKVGDYVMMTIPNVHRKWWQLWLPKLRTVTKTYRIDWKGASHG